MKIFFSIIFLLISFNINAGPYQDRYTSCILENTSERDKIILVKWLFVLLAEHPSLKYDFPTTEDDKINDKVELLSRLSGNVKGFDMSGLVSFNLG